MLFFYLVSYNKLGNTRKTSGKKIIARSCIVHNLKDFTSILSHQMSENKVSNARPPRNLYSDLQAAEVQKLTLRCLKKYQKNKFATSRQIHYAAITPPSEYFIGSCKSKEISIPAFSRVSLQSVLVILCLSLHLKSDLNIFCCNFNP